MSDIHDPAALIATLPSLLPSNDKTLTSPQDAIAALLHTILVALSFKLIGVDDSTQLSIPDSNNALPCEWNKYGPGYYVFRYKHEQSSLEFLVKLCKMGRRTVINAIALQTDKLASLDISTEDFTSPSFYPKTINENNIQHLVHGFISSNRVADLVSQFKLKIIAKLIPGLRKDGYTEVVEPTTSSSSRPPERPPAPAAPRPEPPPDAPQGFPYRQPVTPRNPLEIGRRDLEPFPLNPFAPPSIFTSDNGDGMFVGPDHPVFAMPRRPDATSRGPWGGDGYLPPLGAPPGARFDPVVPGLGPLGRNGRRQPRHLGEPDNDEFMPPGMGDSFM